MFQLTLQITDETIERSLLSLAQQRGSEVSEIIMTALENFLKDQEPLKYKKMDPLTHSSVINYPVTDENLDDVLPFAEVKDANQYVQNSRKKTWSRNA